MSLRLVPRISLLLVQGILWFGAESSATAAGPANSVLHLTNDGFLPGQLRPSDDPTVLRWQSPFFTKPFEFPLSEVNSVHYAVPASQPKSTGEYCFELAGDDVLYGNLLGLTEHEVEVDAARIGRVHVRREHIRRFYRSQARDSIFLGPNGLAGWDDASTTPQWREEGGQLVTDRPGASLFGELGIPAKAVIEFELSWKGKPDFVLGLGVNREDQPTAGAFHFEIWDNDLVVVGEAPRDADVASVQQVGPEEGHVRVQAYLDQEQRRLILLSRSGKPLATLRINAKKPLVGSGVRMTNKRADLRLEHLRVTRWNGLPPREVRDDQARLHRTDGSIVYGALTAFDPRSKQFTVRHGKAETLVHQGAIADAFLSPSLDAKAPAESVADKSSRTLRVVYRDGSRFSGKLTRVEDAHVALLCPAVQEPLRLPLTELRSLVALRHDNERAAPSGNGRPGRLEMEGLRLQGRLVDGSELSDSSCLVWHPDSARNASPLSHGASGRIVYRDPPPPPPPINVTAQSQLGLRRVQPAPPPPRGLGQIITGLLSGDGSTQAAAAGRKSMHLRSGDTIPCEVAQIDEKGVTFKTRLSDTTFVAHEKIKAIELLATREVPRLNKTKRERLLMLPRLLRDSPPTHLIRSKNGDFLRGRIVAMDEERLQVEVRLETKDIPRSRVAQIIWLHGDELADRKAAAAAVKPAHVTRVQAVRAGGNRLTFVAKKTEGKTISGVSDVLGACRAELTEVDELLFGTFIEESAAKLAYHLWKLHHAPDPKFAQTNENGPAADHLTGTESPLVGQPAFAFKLDLLDGKKFHLAEHKGRVVVLDFWATWCGPCLQAMPLVDGVVREFGDRGVELVAINLEEQPEQIKSTLERHKLKLPVALDRDGVAAAKYSVTAIPQTVVIDRDGKVARLYVGGGPKIADTLRKALQELSAGKPAPAASPQ